MSRHASYFDVGQLRTLCRVAGAQRLWPGIRMPGRRIRLVMCAHHRAYLAAAQKHELAGSAIQLVVMEVGTRIVRHGQS